MMKKNVKTILILLLALLMIATTAVMVACVKSEDPTTVTLTVDYGLADVDNVTFTVDIGKPFADKLSQPTSDFTFGGWFMSDGSEVSSSTVAPSNDFTVKAKWRVVYRVEYYLQSGNSYVIDEGQTMDLVGELGDTVTAQVKTFSNYTFDENNANNVISATLNANGVVLKLYYARNAVTVTFDKLIDSATGTMTSVSGEYGSVVTLPQCDFSSKYTFLGWSTAPDGSDGLLIEDGAEYTLRGNVTLYAQWEATYTVVTYVEEFVDDTLTDTHYVKSFEDQNTGIIGHECVVGILGDANKYVLDEEKSTAYGVIGEDTVFEVYLNLRTFTIRYMDDSHTDTVKYGANYTVRTPIQSNPNYRVDSYCEVASGNGTDRAFGSVIANVTKNYVLYPMAVTIYLDYYESDDSVEVNSRKSGLGEATLVKDGERYEGYLKTNNSGLLEFQVEVDGATVYGALFDDDYTFVYRNDSEEGYYIYYDIVISEYFNAILYLDGYGTGILYVYANDGTERWYAYYIAYTLSGYDDYILFYLPYNEDNFDFFMFYNYLPDDLADEDSEFDGIFMFCGMEGLYQYFYQVEDGTLGDYALFLDGYGYAELMLYDDNGSEGAGYYSYKQGIYFASDDYTDEAPEFIFISDDDEIGFYFIWFLDELDGDVYPFFMIKCDEAGEYRISEDLEYPSLYLDGYGGALYFADEDDWGRLGWYTVEDNNSYYLITIEFIDEIGGTLMVTVNKETGIFAIVSEEGDLVITAEGVLIEYRGHASVIVIPEGVVEIAADVFNGVNITSVTFPTTLERIGDRAFSNGTVSGGSALKTATFLGEVPPVLGEDVFRWIKGNFKIIVPDGCEEAYRNAESWQYSASQQEGGYAQFVTSMAEQSNKPLFYIVDGVLLSYNNKDENPHDVHIVIPDEATEIAAGVFTNIDYIVSVDLNNVTVIGANAFYGCYNITEVIFNPNTVSIGARAFYECAGITSVNLYEVRTIGAEAFSRCVGLAEVIIGSSIESIGDYAFYECSREEYEYVVDDEILTGVVQHDLIITISATTAPTMGNYIFQGSQPRVYVASYEVALNYVEANTWTRYITHLRIKADGEQTWYSKTNPGALMILGDMVIFDENYTGLYKWDGNTLYLAWYIYSEIADQKSVHTQTATINSNGELVGVDFSWDGNYAYTFVSAGTTLTYTHDGETLEITFGANQGVFNGNKVETKIVNYRMQFDFDGYTYKVTLLEDMTFYYTSTKITVVTEFRAADGSELTLYDGATLKYVTGTLVNIKGESLTVTSSYSWLLTKLDDSMPNAYYFRFDHAKLGKLQVTLYLDPATATFTYEWSNYATSYVYHDNNNTTAVVTVLEDGTVSSIVILFKTSNGTDDQKAQFTQISDNVYRIVIDGTYVYYDDNDYRHEDPSAFNGTYILTLNPDDNSFTLVSVQ